MNSNHNDIILCLQEYIATKTSTELRDITIEVIRPFRHSSYFEQISTYFQNGRLIYNDESYSETQLVHTITSESSKAYQYVISMKIFETTIQMDVSKVDILYSEGQTQLLASIPYVLSCDYLEGGALPEPVIKTFDWQENIRTFIQDNTQECNMKFQYQLKNNKLIIRANIVSFEPHSIDYFGWINCRFIEDLRPISHLLV